MSKHGSTATDSPAEQEPLVVTFADVAKAAGHACPAVAGAYRSPQLALERLHPDDHPVRSEITVTVDGEPSDSGLGPMANVIRHITGAADETGFAGFGGFGGPEDLLSFGDEVSAFRKQWHARMQRILDGAADGGPSTIENIG